MSGAGARASGARRPRLRSTTVPRNLLIVLVPIIKSSSAQAPTFFFIINFINSLIL